LKVDVRLQVLRSFQAREKLRSQGTSQSRRRIVLNPEHKPGFHSIAQDLSSSDWEGMPSGRKS
jgi:hypothetical protein